VGWVPGVRVGWVSRIRVGWVPGVRVGWVPGVRVGCVSGVQVMWVRVDRTLRWPLGVVCGGVGVVVRGIGDDRRLHGRDLITLKTKSLASNNNPTSYMKRKKKRKRKNTHVHAGQSDVAPELKK